MLGRSGTDDHPHVGMLLSADRPVSKQLLNELEAIVTRHRGRRARAHIFVLKEADVTDRPPKAPKKKPLNKPVVPKMIHIPVKR